MVCKYKNFMLTAFKIMLPSFEYFNNGQQFSIVGFILSLNRNHFFVKKGSQILSAQIISGQLTENPTNNIARTIYFNLNMTL